MKGLEQTCELQTLLCGARSDGREEGEWLRRKVAQRAQAQRVLYRRERERL